MNEFFPCLKNEKFVNIIISIYVFALLSVITVFSVKFFSLNISNLFDRKDSYVKDLLEQMNSEEIYRIRKQNLYGDSDKKKLYEIKSSFLHLWNSYKSHAWGHDVISEDDEYADYCGYAMSMIASIGTLYIMDMQNEVKEIEKYFKKTNLYPKGSVNKAQFLGQVIGGLISAYELTGMKTFQTMFLDYSSKASQVSSTSQTMVLDGNSWRSSKNPVFNIHEFSASILPLHKIYEYTNTKSFFLSSLQPIDDIIQTNRFHGLYQNLYNISSKKEVIGLMSYESNGYSLYEILTKINKLTRDSYPSLHKLIGESTKLFLHKFIDENDSYAYLTRYRGTQKDHVITLDSFLFAAMLKSSKEIPPEYINMYCNYSDKLANGMLNYLNLNDYQLPILSALFNENNKTLTPLNTRYLLNHRILETLLVFYRLTHKNIYREAAWKIFKAVNTTCRTQNGFSSVILDKNGKAEKIDSEIDPNVYSGFFKLMYLIFSDSAFVDLDSWVITPEGHLFKKFKEKNLLVDSEAFTFGDRTSVFN